MKHYWTAVETQALKEYQNSDMDNRNRIFETTLLPALSKLTECVLARSSVMSAIDKKELFDDCLQHATSYLDRINTDENPFAYLNLTIKHFIYHACKRQHRLNTQTISLNVVDKDGDNCSDLLASQIEVSVDNCSDFLASQMEVSFDNNPIKDIDDFDGLLEKTLDYWDERKLKALISCIKGPSGHRNRLLNCLKFFLVRMGSTKISPMRLTKHFQKQNNFNHNTASKILALLGKESRRELLD